VCVAWAVAAIMGANKYIAESIFSYKLYDSSLIPKASRFKHLKLDWNYELKFRKRLGS